MLITLGEGAMGSMYGGCSGYCGIHVLALPALNPSKDINNSGFHVSGCQATFQRISGSGTMRGSYVKRRDVEIQERIYVKASSVNDGK
jgi:hypothetical protein